MSFARNMKCPVCGVEETLNPWLSKCPSCSSSLLDIQYDMDALSRYADRDEIEKRPPLVLKKWREFLPIGDPSKIVSIGERETFLIQCDSLAKQVGVAKLYIKDETAHSTASYKDRSMAMAMTSAVEAGAKMVAIVSTGNAGAASAAYAARANLRCVVLVPSTASPEKLVQILMYGGTVIRVEGGFNDAVDLYLKGLDRFGWYPTGYGNQYRYEGDKTLAYEIAQSFHWKIPDRVVCPTGSGQLISRVYKGFVELKELGWIEELPRLTSVQPAATNALELAFRQKKKRADRITPKPTIASGIAVDDPKEFGILALDGLRATNGSILSLTEEEIRESQRLLARHGGIFAEPAGAVGIVGIRKLRERGEMGNDEVVVVVITGHGLKDPSSVRAVADEVINIPFDFEALRQIAERW